MRNIFLLSHKLKKFSKTEKPLLPIASYHSHFHQNLTFLSSLSKNPDFRDLKPQIQILSMVEPQSLVLNLNEIMEEYTVSEEEVHLKPQTKTTPVAEPDVQKEAQNPAQKEKGQKRAKKSRDEQAKEIEDN